MDSADRLRAANVPRVATLAQSYYPNYPVEQLIEHPGNPRRGDVDAIAESITANGFYGAVLVQSSSLHVIAGNHRLRAARANGIENLPVLMIDVDDDRAKRILLADNRTSDVAMMDDELLRQLLEDLNVTDDELAGTGYGIDDLRGLLAKLDLDAPGEFPTVDEQAETAYRCPSCGYEWNGLPRS